MKRVVLLAVMLSLIIGFAFIVGCSDDDDNGGTGPVTLPDGDMNDPVFIGASEPLYTSGEMVPWGLEPLIRGMITLIDSAGSLKMPAATMQPDTIWYNDANQYWYARESGFDYDYGMSYHTYDSLQFVHGSETSKWPDSATLTRINGGGYRIYTIVTAKDGLAGDTGVYYEFNGTVAGTAGELAGMGDVTANGSGRLYFFSLPLKDAAEVICSYEIHDSFQADNVQINLYSLVLQGGCPFSGSITHNADISLNCSGDTVFTDTDAWYMRETFANDSSHYVVENSDYRWEFSELCEGVIR